MRALLAMGEGLYRHPRRSNAIDSGPDLISPGRSRDGHSPCRQPLGSSTAAATSARSAPSTASTSTSLPGEFFAMLGPSGSGKTTCLRLIAGFEQPNDGHIEIFGETAEGVPPYRRNVNTVFQDYALFPHMTVGENVAYGLHDQGRRPRQSARPRQGREALAMVKLAGYGGPPPGAAFRRPAPARRARPRPGERPEGAAARRAAGRARPEAPRADAGGAEGAAEARSASPSSSSPTTRAKPCRWPTASPSSTTARSSRSARRRMSMSGPRSRFVADFVGSLERALPQNSPRAMAERRNGRASGRRRSASVPLGAACRRRGRATPTARSVDQLSGRGHPLQRCLGRSADHRRGAGRRNELQAWRQGAADLAEIGLVTMEDGA